MPSYLSQFAAESNARLAESPVVTERQTPLHLDLPSERASIVLFDRLKNVGEHDLPLGLIVNVRTEAESIDEGFARAGEIAAYILSAFSCSSRAAIRLPEPLSVHDATPDAGPKEFWTFVYDPALHLFSRKGSSDALLSFLDALYENFLRREDVKDDRKRRLLRAIASFRRGLSDNEDTLTEFLIHWSALETIDVVFREQFGLQSEKIYKTCSGCDTVFRFCPQCGKSLSAQRGELVGVRAAFEELNEGEKFKLLSSLRNPIVHGYGEFQQCVVTAEANLELVRAVLLHMIMRILSVDNEMCEAILRRPSVKGRYRPRIIFKARGIFTPGNITAIDGHPRFDVDFKPPVVEVAQGGKELRVIPTHDLRLANVDQVQGDIVTEIWGEPGSEIRVRNSRIRVIRGRGK